jgi:hypothetical protein
MKRNKAIFENKISHIIKVYRVSIFIQILLNALITIIISQIIFGFKYSTILLILITTISYGFAIFNMSLLSYMFLKWFLVKKNALTLIYGLGSVFVAINALISIILFDTVLSQKDSFIPYNTVVLFPGFDEWTLMSWIFSFQTYTNISYFILMWMGTVILLKYKINKIGSLKFCILSILPLIYLMSYYFTLYDTLNPEAPIAASANLTGLILFFGFSALGGGITVAFGFREISKSINSENVKNFLKLTSIGFLLYFITGAASIGQAPYPPYGIINVSMVGLSSLLILEGLYLSATYLSTYRRQRNLIKSTLDASRLLGSIGTAQRNLEIEKITSKVLKEQEKDNDDITDTPLNENEIKSYIDEILMDLKKRRKS